MARAPQIDGMRCIMCGERIPDERLMRRKDTITCSLVCSKERDKYWRRRRDEKQCRYCQHPATPEEQARYRRWRAWEKKNPPTEAEVQASTITEQENDDAEDVQSVPNCG